MTSFSPFDLPTTPIPQVQQTSVEATTPIKPAGIKPAGIKPEGIEPEGAKPEGKAGGSLGVLSGWRSPQHRDGMALVISSALTSAIGLLYWVVAARLFDHATVGLNSTAVSAMTLLGTAAHLNLGNAMLRFVPIAGPFTRSLVRRCNAAALLAATTFGLVFVLGADLWASDLLEAAGRPALFLFFVLSTPIWTLFVLQDSTLPAIGRATAVPVKNLVFSVLKIVLLGVAAWLGTTSGIAVSWVIGTALCAVGVSLWLARAMPPGPDPGTRAEAPVSMRDVAGFIRYDYAGNVCWQSAVFGLPLVVLALAGPENAATYNIVSQIAMALYLVVNGMGQSLLAHNAADPAGLRAAVRSMVVKALTLLVPAVVVIAPGSYLVLSLFGPEYASSGALLLALFSLSAIPNVITQTTVWTARVQRKGVVQVALPATLAALVIGGTCLLIPIFGITGAGMAWLGAQTLLAVTILIHRWVSGRR
jgi:O-antigen/teichoic acid export membrane protein